MSGHQIRFKFKIKVFKIIFSIVRNIKLYIIFVFVIAVLENHLKCKIGEDYIFISLFAEKI